MKKTDFKRFDPVFIETCEKLEANGGVCVNIYCDDCPMNYLEYKYDCGDEPADREDAERCNFAKEYLKLYQEDKMEQFTIIPKDEQEHVAMQEKLFEGGFGWWHGGKKVNHASFCSITTLPNKRLNNDSGCNTPLKAIENASRDYSKIITAKEFLENPEIVDGWKKPEPDIEITVKLNGKESSLKEISEETLINIRNKS